MAADRIAAPGPNDTDPASQSPERTAAAEVRAAVAVIGAGPAGMAAALALAHKGVDTLLIGPPAGPDARTTALLGASADVLTDVGVWPRLQERAIPLEIMRIIDDTGRLVRAPEVSFSSGELGLTAFGWNVTNDDLNAAMAATVKAATKSGRLRVLPALARGFDLDDDGVTIHTDGATVRASLVVAADGARSPARAAAGIETVSWSYPQAAFVTTLSHRRAHGFASTEFHTPAGPFTLVPLAGNRSSLVWVERPERARALCELAPGVLSREIERQAHSLLGEMTVDGPCAAIPLGTHMARHFAARRVALVGEAGHRIPPIGAQGLNLSLRDVSSLADIVGRAARNGGDVGALPVLDAYDRARRADVAGRAVGIDLLNRSLLSGFLPFQLGRSLGLYMASEVPPLRRLLMRGGLGPGVGPGGGGRLAGGIGGAGAKRPRRPLVASGSCLW